MPVVPPVMMAVLLARTPVSGILIGKTKGARKRLRCGIAKWRKLAVQRDGRVVSQ